jgi:biopolymer transport protein ExbB
MSWHLQALAENTWYLLRQGSWVMVAIFIAGQAGWYFVVERWWYYRTRTCDVPNLLRDMKNMEADPNALEHRLLSDRRVRGVFKEIVQALAESRPLGREAMVNRTREVLQSAGSRLTRHLSTIAVLAAAAPLLGLTGTVVGIMVTFQVITLYGVGNPSMLAGGIAQALMVTEAGLVVAFPLLLLHDHLHNRASAIESDCVAGATTLIRVLSQEAT